MANSNQLVVGRGTMQQVRPGVWRIRHNMGRDPRTGKYRYSPWKTIYTTRKREVANALEEYKHELNDGLLDHDVNITVAEYATQFHQLRAGTSLSPLSYKTEEREVRKICELFGDIKLSELKPFTIKETYARLRAEGETSEGCLHRIHVRLKQILEEAVDDEIIVRNPCAKISVPRPKAVERPSLSEEEAARLLTLLEKADPDPRVIATYLMLQTGMRRGEALGLTWERIDFESGDIFIAQQYAADKAIRAPKSDAGKRHLSIDAETIEFLLNWRTVQAYQLASMGVQQTGGTPVAHCLADAKRESTPFGNAVRAKHLDPPNYERWFHGFCLENGFGDFSKTEIVYHAKIRKDGKWKTLKTTKEEYQRLKEEGERLKFVKTVVKRTGYKGLTPHMLRHTHATLLIGKGVDLKTVQTRLGHAQLGTTVDIYSHAIKSNDKHAAAVFRGSLTGRDPKEIEELLAKAAEEARRANREKPRVLKEAAEEAASKAGPRTGAEAVDAVRGFALRQKKDFTKRQAMEACHIDSMKWMSVALTTLQREGVVKKVGTSRDARYRTSGRVAASA